MMSAKVLSSPPAAKSPTKFTFPLPVDEYRSLPIPGTPGGKLGICHVRVTDLPERLEEFMEVNPRVPSRTKEGVLSGPVVRGILETLSEHPGEMVVMNQGLYLLVDDVAFEKGTGGAGRLLVTLTDKNRHGLVNGGHTFCAIRQAIEDAEGNVDEENALRYAFVRLHLMQGIDKTRVAEIAEGLNRSKQVDDPSLMNLQGHFERIQEVMRGKPGEKAIAYYQGDDGEMYITEILVFLEMFNKERYGERNHPHNLFWRRHHAREFFETDIKARPSPMALVIPKLPEILKLYDMIRQAVPDAAKRTGSEYGQMKLSKTKKERAGTPKQSVIKLPFLNSTMRHRVSNAWVYPMLAAFRANVDWDLETGKFQWRMPVEEVLKDVIDDLASICVSEHRASAEPEMVGKRESTYAQCHDKVMLSLLKGKLRDSSGA